MRLILRVSEENPHVETVSSGRKNPLGSFPPAWSTLRPPFHSCPVAVFIFLVEFSVVWHALTCYVKLDNSLKIESNLTFL